MMYFNQWYSSGFNPAFMFGAMQWFLPLILLDLVLRGVALWRAARAKQQWWFIALLVVNSAGILPLIYLLLYRESTAPSARKKR